MNESIKIELKEIEVQISKVEEAFEALKNNKTNYLNLLADKGAEPSAIAA